MTRSRIIRILKENMIDSRGELYGDGINKINLRGVKNECESVIIEEVKINMGFGSTEEFEAIRKMQERVEIEHGIQINSLVLVI